LAPIMKLAFPNAGAARGAGKKSGRSAKRLSLAHARVQLEQAVGSVLAGSLEVLGERLLAGLPQESASKAEQRLRDVVHSDRALDAIHAPAKTAPKPAPKAAAAEVENRAELTLADEPIRTRTMARLLATQGYRKRALAIYAELVGKQPDNTELRSERDRLLAAP
jgi:hypothetical protein